MKPLDRVKTLAKKRGWSLQKVATEAGIGINSIYRWSSKTPSTNSLQAVADVLGVSVDYLLGNTDEMHIVPTETKVDLAEVSKSDTWDEYLSADGKPLSDQDKRVLRALFGE